MTYQKNTWVDQEVERPRTYEMTNNSDGSVTLIDSFGLVNELGTPVNADNMNNIEEGVNELFKEGIAKYSSEMTYSATSVVKSAQDGDIRLYRSLTENNKGNSLNDSANWKELILGGSGNFTPFCLNSGSVDSKGKPAILSYDKETQILTVSAPFVYTTASGKTKTAAQNLTFDMSQIEEGIYYLLINDGTKELELTKHLTISKKFPQNPLDGDVVFNYNIEPYSSYKSQSGEWIKTDYARIACVERVWGGGVTMRTFEYNDNGLNNKTDTLPIGFIGQTIFPIDESLCFQRYLNGQIIIQDQYISFTQKVKDAVALYPSISTAEENWQAQKASSAFGQAGKFVIDDTAGTIRLPAVVNAQGLFDLTKAGMTVEAGLPNITGSFTSDNGIATDGCFYRSGDSSSGATNDNNGQWTTFDAHRSKTIYGNSDTVQQEAIKYPYFIQVSTGVEESLPSIRDYEVINPNTLLESKYTTCILNNPSWLRSNGQWNPKALFSDAYDEILKEYNNPTRDLPIKLSTEEYTAYDFVLSTVDETFRLPLKSHIISGGDVPVVGNGKTIGLTNGTNNFGIYSTDYINGTLGGSQYIYATSVDSVAHTGGLAAQGGLGLTEDSSESGMIVKLSQSVNENAYLYFYVGAVVQNAKIVNVGRIEEQLLEKLDRTHKPEIINWGMPDYSEGMDVSFPIETNSFTPSCDGIYVVNILDNVSANIIYAYINGKKSAFAHRNGGVNIDTSSMTIPLSKNDTIYFDKQPYSVFTSIFYPFKGAN